MDTTNVVISPSFEKYTIGIGPRLLSKMGYTKEGLRKNIQVTTTPTILEMKEPRIGLGYDVVVASLSSLGLAKSRKFLFVAGGIQTEEKLIVDCVE